MDDFVHVGKRGGPAGIEARSSWHQACWSPRLQVMPRVSLEYWAGENREGRLRLLSFLYWEVQWKLSWPSGYIAGIFRCESYRTLWGEFRSFAPQGREFGIGALYTAFCVAARLVFQTLFGVV